MLPNPLHAYDISHDGTAAPAAKVSADVADNIAYRWLHFDLSDPHLQSWCDTALPPRAARALLAAKTRPHMDDDEKGIVLTLRGINLNDGQELANMVSLRLWITPQLVVSVRRLPVKTVDALAQSIVAGNCPATPGNLITRVTEHIVERVEKVSVDLEERTDAMEDGVYQSGATEIPDLFELQRTAIRLRALSTHIDITQEARIARNGYTLSVVAAIFLPLSFVTGLLGVNVGGMPWGDHPDAFMILCASMVVLGAATYAILRWIKWF